MSGPGLELDKALVTLRARVLWRIAQLIGSSVRERVVVKMADTMQDSDVLDFVELRWRWLPRFFRSFRRNKIAM